MIQAKTPKLKRGQKFNHSELGPVIMWHDKEDATCLVAVDYGETIEYEVVRTVDLTPITKPRTPLVSKPKPLTTTEKSEKQKLNEFYLQISFDIPIDCQNCGHELMAYNSYAKRSCTCHILSKAQFPELATDENNIWFGGASFLGACGCHDKWDNGDAETRKSMPVYLLCVLKYQTKLRSKLSPAQQIKADKYLGL